jgi:hypothetical protein
LDPDQVTYGSGKKVWWKCQKDPQHEWNSSIDNRTKGRGCPFCAGQKITASNSLKSLYPQIAEEWHPIKNQNLNPDQITHGSGKKIWWKCSKESGHEWRTSISNRTKNKTGCPYCEGRKVSQTNRLSKKFPEIAKEWHPVKNIGVSPDDIVAGTRMKAWWICINNSDHVWKARIDHRTSSNSGCPYCNVGANGNLWKLWEEWCGKVIFLLHPNNSQMYPNTRLPNGKYPDFSYQDNYGQNIIVDAKTTALARSIEKSIQYYLPYCDCLEFWCLFKKRETIFLNDKQILFVSPQIILSRIKKETMKISLEKELDSVVDRAHR